MADNGPPPLQGGSEDESDFEAGEEDTESEESGRDSEESGRDSEGNGDQEEEEGEEEPPPAMYAYSGSEEEDEEPAPKPKKNPPGKAKTKDANGGTKTGKPAAAAGSSKKGKGGGKEPEVSPLWTAFSKSREGVDRLGITHLKKWESFVKDVPKSFQNWYKDQVLGSRSVPQALLIAGLPSGFAEFCHWVAAGNHRSCGANLKAGFEPLAMNLVKQVEDEGRPPERSSSAPSSMATASASVIASRGDSYAGASTSGAGRGGVAAAGAAFRVGVAPSSEPLAGIDLRVRKRDRPNRREKAPNFAQKLLSVITELEGATGFDDYDGRKSSAAARAIGSGHRAEDEVRNLMRGEDVLDESATVTALDVLGPAFSDSRLPKGTLAMLSHLKRARAYRRRADRQQECLENELEKCLGRLARVERQYMSLVAETSGHEGSLVFCLARARTLIEEAFGPLGAGDAGQALDSYDDAIKLLEVHVDKARNPQDSGGESADSEEARTLLGLALCSRSVASYRLGNFYSGKRDAERAVVKCPGSMAQENLKRIQDFDKTLDGAAARPQWTPFPRPP